MNSVPHPPVSVKARLVPCASSISTREFFMTRRKPFRSFFIYFTPPSTENNARPESYWFWLTNPSRGSFILAPKWKADFHGAPNTSDIELSTESNGPIGKASQNRKKNRFVSDIDQGAAAKLQRNINGLILFYKTDTCCDSISTLRPCCSCQQPLAVARTMASGVDWVKWLLGITLSLEKFHLRVSQARECSVKNLSRASTKLVMQCSATHISFHLNKWLIVDKVGKFCAAVEFSNFRWL